MSRRLIRSRLPSPYFAFSAGYSVIWHRLWAQGTKQLAEVAVHVLAAFQRRLHPGQQVHEDVCRRQPRGSCRHELDRGGAHCN